jgi:ABC-type polysaccharide/polyol phosphate export permease
LTALAELAQSRELVTNLTLREVRGKYKRTVLGQGWSLVNPLATMATYTLVFGVLLKAGKNLEHGNHDIHAFAVWLLGGLLAWTFFNNAVTTGMTSLISNGNLIKKVYFPRELLVVSTISSLVVTMLIELGVLGAILLLVGNMVIPWIPVILLLVAIQTVFVLGIALALSVWNVYFRDMQHLVAILLQVLFYTCPIVYPIRFVPIHATVAGVEIPLRRIYELNPLVRFIGCFRDVMYDLRFPPLWDLTYITLWAVATAAFGMWVFGRLDGRLAEEV